MRVLSHLFRYVLLASILILSIKNIAAINHPNPGINTEEFDAIIKDFDQIKEEFDKSLPALEKLKTEFDDFLKDADLNDSGLFKNFRNKILYSIPVHEKLSFGLYGADILKFLFFVSYIYIDKILFNNLQVYYQQNIVSDFKNKKDILIALYDEKVAFKTIPNFISDTNAKKSFIDECCTTLDLKHGLNYKLFSYVGLNLLGKEGIKLFEHQVFPIKGSSFLDLFKQSNNPAKKIEDSESIVMSIYPIINLLLTSNILGMLPTVEEDIKIIRSFSFKLVGWNYKFFDNYGIDLTRRMLILTIFLNRLNIWYQNMFKEYLKQNLEEFLKILSDLKNSQFLDTNKEKNEDEYLKNFINSGLDCSFKKWFSYKTQCCAKVGILIEGIILLPVMYKGGYFIYNNFIRKA